MGTVNKYFNYYEFGCGCGECEYTDGTGIHPRVIDLMYDIRVVLDRPIRITSGIRCEAYNEKVGGKGFSYHLPLQGCRAVDFKLENGIECYERYAITKVCINHSASIGFYQTFCHVDVRPIPLIFI